MFAEVLPFISKGVKDLVQVGQGLEINSSIRRLVGDVRITGWKKDNHVTLETLEISTRATYITSYFCPVTQIQIVSF